MSEESVGATDRSEEWLEVDADATNVEPEIVAQILEGVAETLREAPDGYRYDFELSVDEDGGLDG